MFGTFIKVSMTQFCRNCNHVCHCSMRCDYVWSVVTVTPRTQCKKYYVYPDEVKSYGCRVVKVDENDIVYVNKEPKYSFLKSKPKHKSVYKVAVWLYPIDKCKCCECDCVSQSISYKDYDDKGCCCW